MRNRILILAYAVSPERGSECSVGWQICRRLGKYHDLTVLHVDTTPAGAPYKKEIQIWEQRHKKIPGVTFISVPMPKYTQLYTKLHDIGLWPFYYLSYNAWHRSAFRTARQLHIEHPFALAHQLNMIGFREPGYLWKLDIPFVWGPVGGFNQIPSLFNKQFDLYSQMALSLRNSVNHLQMSYNRRPKKAARKAKKLWVVGKEGQECIKKHWNVTAQCMLETGTKAATRKYIKKTCTDSTLHIIWCGQIHYYKGLSILLKALSLLEKNSFELTVVGDGPERTSSKQLAKELNIDKNIYWKGWIHKVQVLKYMKQADILVHSSIKDATTNVIMEALGVGLPVLCHDYSGMGTAIDEECGFKIPLKDPQTSIVGFAEAMRKLCENRSLLKRLSNGARNRASALSWDSKVKHIAETYSEIISQQSK